MGCVKKLLLILPGAGTAREPRCLRRCRLGSSGRAGAAGLETLKKSARQLKGAEVAVAAPARARRRVGN